MPPVSHQGAPLSMSEPTAKWYTRAGCSLVLDSWVWQPSRLPWAPQQEGAGLCLQWVLIWETAGTPLPNCGLSPPPSDQEAEEWSLR